MLINIVKDEKKNDGSLIGFIRNTEYKGKVVFLDKKIKIPAYLTGTGYFKITENDLQQHEKFAIVKNIEFPELEDLENEIKVLKNACGCSFCYGTQAQGYQYLAGARNPRAYYYDENMIIAKPLAANSTYTVYNHTVYIDDCGEEYSISGDVIYADDDSDHGCWKIVERQSVIFIKKWEMKNRTLNTKIEDYLKKNNS